MLAIQLNPLSPFHLQTGGLDHERVDSFPRSDTISSALMYLWARQFGKIPGLPEAPPFLLSSIFPMLVSEDGAVKKRFFPKPKHLSYNMFRKWTNEEAFGHKEFKNIIWLDEELFRLALDDINELRQFVPESSPDKRLWCGGKAWCKEIRSPVPDDEALLAENELTRVVLDRVTQAATPFHFVTTNFNKDTRLFFIADIDENQKDIFLMLLRMLGDEGLGADRTVGLGRFEVDEVEEWTFSFQNKSNAWLSLGLFNPDRPTRQNIRWNESNYNLSIRSGWVSDPVLRRRTVLMTEEGSVFATEVRPQGRLVNVLDKDDPQILERHREYLAQVAKLDHPVYRDGRTILLPMNLVEL